MPFYEYECDNCKFYTELLQKISDPPLKKCPSCGKSTMKKLVSAPVFRLKGGGWYETDFKSDQEGKRNLAVEKEPESASDAAKPAATADAKDSKSTDTKASEAKTSESKPAAESKSAASKSASSRSGARARPAAAKSKSAAKSRAKPAAKRRKSR